MLAVEITSRGNAETDRTEELRGYANAAVPLYLLVDSWHPNGAAATLFENSGNGTYQRHTTVPFGKPIALPEPFDLELDTSEFPLPATAAEEDD
ncbi:hypothetical protein GCM10022402_41580 [Salinactinospora qingdaonensis]|uniref:Putative restriction endonuclease domain-containing protein n=1 Tax=Salinactinospora qingdaonensis TaxID=702744 RepID=A0ABP7GFJ3_9ACTN